MKELKVAQFFTKGAHKFHNISKIAQSGHTAEIDIRLSPPLEILNA